MNTNKLSPTEFFKALQIVHLALMAGIFLFSLVAFTLFTTGQFTAERQDLDGLLRYVVPFLMIASLMAGNLIFKQRLRECIQLHGLKTKLENYRGALIMKYAFIEGPAFFAVISYMLTGNLIYLGLVAVLLIVFLVNRPSKEKAITELELDFQEREIINDPDAVVD